MKARLLFPLALIVVAVLAVWYLTRPSASNESRDILQTIRNEAMGLQEKRDWCGAKKKWQDLAARASGYPDLKAEAEANGRIAGQRCDGSLVKELTIETPNDPTMVTPERLLQHYPAGRVVQSFGVMRMAGRGSDEKWVFKGDANFRYDARALGSTKILTNNGNRIEFETDVKEIDQTMLVTERSVRLRPIESPWLQIVWDQADKQLALLPAYRIVREFSKADPRLERTLTWLAEQGISPSDAEETQMIESIGALSGYRLKMEYVSGFGITKLEVVNGEALPKEALNAFARHSGLLLDYFIGEVLTKKVGDEFAVGASNVVRMMGLQDDADVNGEIKLRREPDDGDFAVMSIVGGEVIVEATVKGIRRRGRLAPAQGKVKYHRDDLLVTEARIDWTTDISWATENHLLFATRGAREVQADSYYEARLALAK